MDDDQSGYFFFGSKSADLTKMPSTVVPSLDFHCTTSRRAVSKFLELIAAMGEPASAGSSLKLVGSTRGVPPPLGTMAMRRFVKKKYLAASDVT